MKIRNIVQYCTQDLFKLWKSNDKEKFSIGTRDFDRIREVFKLKRFEFRRLIYNSLLRKFDGEFEFGQTQRDSKYDGSN